MKNTKVKLILFIIISVAVVTLLLVYSKPIAKFIAPIAEFTVRLLL